MAQEKLTDFEIAFFEGVLRFKPDYAEALFVLGDAYSRRGRYQEGLQVDLRLAELRPADPLVRYNLACDYALLQRADECMDALVKAIRLGYRDFSFMQRDPDLAFIRSDPRYQRLLTVCLLKTRAASKTVR